jgi:hypothetical protein
MTKATMPSVRRNLDGTKSFPSMTRRRERVETIFASTVKQHPPRFQILNQKIVRKVFE